jgi:biopolymer transport protein ExbD
MDDAAILVAISPSDEIWIDKDVVAPPDVRTVLEKLHAENPKGSMVIQADQDSTNEFLVVVMEAAKAAGIENVAISTVRN